MALIIAERKKMASVLLITSATEEISMKKLLLLVSMFLCIIGFSQAPKSENQQDAIDRKEVAKQEAEAKLRKEKQKQQEVEREQIEGYSPINQPSQQQQQQ